MVPGLMCALRVEGATAVNSDSGGKSVGGHGEPQVYRLRRSIVNKKLRIEGKQLRRRLPGEGGNSRGGPAKCIPPAVATLHEAVTMNGLVPATEDLVQSERFASEKSLSTRTTGEERNRT